MIRRLSMVGIILIWSCAGKSFHRLINDPENGYLMEASGPGYVMRIQYQPPEYHVEQERVINQSTVSSEELMEDYSKIQQFLIRYQCDNMESYGQSELLSSFSLIASDTVACMDVHQVPEIPGSAFNEILLLFPADQKTLGTSFQLKVNDFPYRGIRQTVPFNLLKTN